MSLTLRDLLDVPEFGLQVLCPGALDSLDRTVIWVHLTEVLDSREFSEPGEVLLTTGLGLPVWPVSEQKTERYAAVCDEFVRGMVDAGVVACGFGVGIKHEQVPPPLVHAATVRNLLLFSVPREVPFQDIERRMSRSLADDEYAQLRVSHSFQRRLIAAAGSEDPVHAVVMRTAESVGGWSAFMGTRGEVIDVSHIASREQARNLGLEFIGRRRLESRDRTASRSMRVIRDGWEFVIAEIRDDSGISLGFIAGGVRTSAHRDSVLQAVVMSAAEILAIVVRQKDVRDSRWGHIRSRMIRSLAYGVVDEPLALASDLWGGTPREPVEVTLVEPSPGTSGGGLSSIEESLATYAQSMMDVHGRGLAGHPLVFGVYNDRLWIIHAVSDVDRLDGLLRPAHERETPCMGRSDGHSWDDIRSGFAEARTSARLAVISGHEHSAQRRGGDTRHEDFRERLADLTQLDLVDPDVAESYARVLLDPLINDGPRMRQTRHVLFATLTHLVDCSFSPTRCASRMGVHRHTIENRMERIQSMLGLDLSSTADQSRLWFAVEALRQRMVEDCGGFTVNDA